MFFRKFCLGPGLPGARFLQVHNLEHAQSPLQACLFSRRTKCHLQALHQSSPGRQAVASSFHRFNAESLRKQNLVLCPKLHSQEMSEPGSEPMHIAPTNRNLPCLQNWPQVQRRHGGSPAPLLLVPWPPWCPPHPQVQRQGMSFLLCVFYPGAGTETASGRLTRKVGKRLWKVLIAEPHPGAAWATPEGIHRRSQR